MVFTDSNLVPVLDLRPPSKSLSVHQANCHLPGAFVVVQGFRGRVREWPEEFIRLKQISIWPCVGRALHRNCGADGACEGEMAITGEPQNSVSLCPSLSSSESG